MSGSKPRKVRGILGYPKLEHPTLFTFQPRESGQYWPSDDDSWDSDFVPYSDEEETGFDEKKHEQNKNKSDEEQEQNKSVSSRTRADKNARTKDKKEKKKKRKRSKSSTCDRPGPSGHCAKHATDAGQSGEGDTHKLHKSKKKKKSDSVRTIDSDSPCESAEEGIWGEQIPLLALEKIFSHAIEGTGAVPLLCRLSRVCSLWRQAANQPMLWQHVDLANGRVKMTDKTLQYLAPLRLSQLRDINLSGWTKLSDEGLKSLIVHCPCLQRINLTKCTSLSADVVKSLAEKCKKLNAIDISLASNDVLLPSNLKSLIETFGSRLEHLVCTQNMLKAGPTFLKAISTNCSFLKTLDLSNCRFSTDFLGLPIEELQTGCPNLRVLRLAGSKVRAQQATNKAKAESPGFVHLSELSLAVNTEAPINIGVGIGDQFLTRIMKNSRNLKLLDLRGLTHISAKGVESLTVDHLEHLYISQCSLSKYEGVETVVQKWRHSLVELDLSWNVFPAMSLDVAMKKLSSGPGKSVLQKVNLGGTSITADRVRSILEGCPNLESINLTSCRGLPRGMKRLHENEDLKQLAQQLGVNKDR